MKAAILTDFGSVDNVKYVKNREIPSCAPHQVVLQVKACALSDLDLSVRYGLLTKFLCTSEAAGVKRTEAAPAAGGGGEDDVPSKLPRRHVVGYQVSGIVHEIGSEVQNVNAGDAVVALLPLDAVHGGCAQYTVADAVSVVPKPELVSHEEAAAMLYSGLSAYTALHYQTRIRASEFVLVCGATFAADTLLIQLAGHLGAKVIVAACTSEEYNAYRDCGDHVSRVIDVSTEDVVSAVMEETGGLGVNCVVDLQQAHLLKTIARFEQEESQRFAREEEQPDEEDDNELIRTSLENATAPQQGAKKAPLAVDADEDENRVFVNTDQIIQCLAVHARWVSSTPNLQLDPPQAEQLFYRSASLAFLFAPCWNLAPSQHGRFLHILTHLLDQAASGVLGKLTKPRVFPIDRVRQAQRDLEDSSAMGCVVVRV